MINPGVISLELLVGDSLTYFVILLGASTVAGLLAGKKESDDAKAGIGDKSRENLTWIDWAEDAGYGFIGGLIGLAMIQMIPGTPDLLLPTFGYAGRKLLYAWGQKAEQTGSPK